MRGINAKFRALQYLLKEKLLRLKIYEEEIIKMSGGGDNDEINVYEREIIMGMDQDKSQKEQELKNSLDIIR